MKLNPTTLPAPSKHKVLLWATRTFGSSKLGDKRRTDRAVDMLGQKAMRPSDSIPQGADDPAQAKGTYRFLENEHVSADPLWQSLHEETARGLAGTPQVYVLHDTTSLMFPKRPATEGLGTIKGDKAEALLMHSALAVRPGGHILGLLHNAVWARPPKELGKTQKRRKRAYEEKESIKWSRGVAEATTLRDLHCPNTQFVHIMDREGDIWHLLKEMTSGDDAIVIRCAQNRSVEGPHGTIRAHMTAQPVLERKRIDVPRKPNQRKRRATIEVRTAEVTVCAPTRISRSETVCLRAVWVHEPSPPEGVTPLNWLLWTTLPVGTAKEALTVVKAYKLRWRIEDFHLALKSGCRIEDSQLRTAGRIETWLVFCCAVVATDPLGSKCSGRLVPGGSERPRVAIAVGSSPPAPCPTGPLAAHDAEGGAHARATRRPSGPQRGRYAWRALSVEGLDAFRASRGRLPHPSIGSCGPSRPFPAFPAPYPPVQVPVRRLPRPPGACAPRVAPAPEEMWAKVSPGGEGSNGPELPTACSVSRSLDRGQDCGEYAFGGGFRTALASHMVESA